MSGDQKQIQMLHIDGVDYEPVAGFPDQGFPGHGFDIVDAQVQVSWSAATFGDVGRDLRPTGGRRVELIGSLPKGNSIAQFGVDMPPGTRMHIWLYPLHSAQRDENLIARGGRLAWPATVTGRNVSIPDRPLMVGAYIEPELVDRLADLQVSGRLDKARITIQLENLFVERRARALGLGDEAFFSTDHVIHGYVQSLLFNSSTSAVAVDRKFPEPEPFDPDVEHLIKDIAEKLGHIASGGVVLVLITLFFAWRALR